MAAKAEPGHPESGKLHQRWRKAKEAGNLSTFASPAELRALVQAKLTPEEQVRFGMQCAGLAAKALEVLDKSLTSLEQDIENESCDWEIESDAAMDRVARRFLADLEQLKQTGSARRLTQLSIWRRISRYVVLAERRAAEASRQREHELQAEGSPFVRQVAKIADQASKTPGYRQVVAWEHLEELADAATADGVFGSQSRSMSRILRRPESRFRLLLTKLELGEELCTPEERRLMLALDTSDARLEPERMRSRKRAPGGAQDGASAKRDHGRSASVSSSSSSLEPEHEDHVHPAAKNASSVRKKRRHHRRRSSNKNETLENPQ
jgi:hypothetical protein